MTQFEIRAWRNRHILCHASNRDKLTVALRAELASLEVERHGSHLDRCFGHKRPAKPVRSHMRLAA